MSNDDSLKTLVEALTTRLGRLPTEDEIIKFINGDMETRQEIWNSIKED